MSQKSVGISNLPNVRYRSFCKAGIDFNIMTIGSNGLGKSSFINQILGVHALSSDPFLEEYGQNSGTSEMSDNLQEDKYFHKDALLNIQISKFFVIENGFQARITVTEVDGVGDNVNNEGCWEPVVDLINDNFRDFLEQEKKNVRPLIKDKRIHICIYFLEPNPGFVRTADIRTMKEISRVCNLIPVVGKSDLLNDAEKQECYNRIFEILSVEDIDTFPLESPKKDGVEVIRGPFFITCKSLGDEAANENPTERKYPWGSVLLEKIIGNDFYTLTKMLITKNLINSIETTESLYGSYKTKNISISSGKTFEKDDDIMREVQEKIEKEEMTIKEIKMRILEKKKQYELELLEMANKN